MIAIEYAGGASRQARLPVDEWAQQMLLATGGRGIVGYAPTREAEAEFRLALDALGVSAGALMSPRDLPQVDIVIARTPAAMAQLAWQRQALMNIRGHSGVDSTLAHDGHIVWGPSAFSIVTLVDESTVKRWLAELAGLVAMPIYPWDAIVCSSHQVRRQVLWAFRAQMAQLGQRFGVSRLIVPKVEVIHPGLIPLSLRQGEIVDAPMLLIERERRPDDVVVLVRDRNDEVLALRQALEALYRDESASRTAENDETGEESPGLLNRLLIVQAGCQAMDLELTSIGVRSLRLEHVEDEHRMRALYRHVDVVCLLPTLAAADDTQALLAAARARAAIIASDMGAASDLCRFLDVVQVRPDCVGVKVETWCAPADADGELAMLGGVPLDAYSRSSSSDDLDNEVKAVSAIDIDGLARALRLLGSSPALRVDLGDRASEFISESGWGAGLAALQRLFSRLRETAAEASANATAQSQDALPDPAHPDPLHLQEAAVTHTLAPDTRLAFSGAVDPTWSTAEIVKRAGLLFKASGMQIHRVLPAVEDLVLVVERLLALEQQAWPGLAARDAVVDVPASRQVHVFRSLVWCVRIGLLRILKAPIASERSVQAAPTNGHDLSGVHDPAVQDEVGGVEHAGARERLQAS